MGGCCCKCTPRWANNEDVVCAYIYEECACFRKRKYVLYGAGKEDSLWNLPSSQTARSLVEGDIFDPHGIPISIAAEVPKGCCGYEMFEAAVEGLEKEWSPKMNRQLEPYGFRVDGFEWVEYRYISNGQGGGHTQPVPHFCIRIRATNTTERFANQEELKDANKPSKRLVPPRMTTTSINSQEEGESKYM
eukprot:CAMPEP_0113629088 /NCGR_PEP_ID=MMETSP0017_2-20120614/15091_1 /TAXON_ID=2856 /ORGANISM="Cylindrotheca closterium" /LENGTH=189 /DNA_ID=CAMNT_0000539455 /DNA_START=425 /DNA_END=995 /DNA_ORIENTATION=+ /assembly_acc=CAM_ASM_000147